MTKEIKLVTVYGKEGRFARKVMKSISEPNVSIVELPISEFITDKISWPQENIIIPVSSSCKN